jgi:sporulation protein YlmC with PRC-barrel domain
MEDDGHAIAFQVLARGTPVVASDGAEVGTVRDVLENEREHIFDGLVLDTPAGPRWVDAPEIARIAERRVTLTITAAEAAALPKEDPAGAEEFHADVRGGRLSRMFGGPWKRRR